MATDPCKAAGKPVKSTYKPKGKITKLGDLPVYEIGVGKKAIILHYDIFGWNEVSKNVFEFADLLAKKGFYVIMPDHFRGLPCNISDFPPTTDLQKQVFKSWKEGVGSSIQMKKDIYELVLPHLYTSNMNNVGCIGFCWGGKMAFVLGQDADRFGAIAVIHGSMIDDNTVNALRVPLYYGPSKDDVPVANVKKILDAKKKLGKEFNFSRKCVYNEYSNQGHGFCAARGDWKDAKVKKDVDIVIKETSKFFNKHV